MVNFMKNVITVFKHADRLNRAPQFSDVKRRPRQLWLALSDDAMAIIKRFRKLTNDYEVANALDFSDSYISLVVNRQRPVSTELQARIVSLLSLEEQNWSTLFRWIDAGEYDGSHQRHNQMKAEGAMPYRCNVTAAFRAKDNDVCYRPSTGDNTIKVISKDGCRRGRKKVEKKLDNV